MLSNILLPRLTSHLNEITGYHKCGFLRNRSTANHTFCVCQRPKKMGVHGTTDQLFIDFKKAYESGEKYCTTFSLKLV